MQKRIDLKVGFQCNNRCLFCVQGDKRHEHGDRSTQEVVDILQTSRSEYEGVVFTGGEITIRPDLMEIVTAARDLDYEVIQLQTNGRMLSHMPTVEALVEAGVTEFSPALHGHTAEIHDGLTRAPGAFRQTVRGIRNVVSLGHMVITNSVITQQNAPYLPQLARLLVGLGVYQYQLAFVHALGTAAQNFDTVVPRYEEIQDKVSEALLVGIRADVRCMTEAIPLCFLGPYRKFAAEFVALSTKVFDAKHTIDDYGEMRRVEGKAKGPPCANCSLDHVCEGPWKEYPQHYGWDAFVPVLDDDESSAE